ncbi:MAG: cytochrome c-type biogenesis protein CcmH [Chloroflexi bacterium]|nr:cytochrome c-type biogenesis protein CcmH [Chloroflexota bacterium]
MKRLPVFLLALAALGALLAAGPARAQGETPPAPAATPSDDAVNAIAKNLYCPVCENVPLDVCPTLACQRWREQIREKLAEGWSEQEILDYFVLQYGDRVLAAPPRRGFNWLIYLAPPALIALGAWTLYRLMGRMRLAAQAAQTARMDARPQHVDDDTLARLEDELKRRDQGE